RGETRILEGHDAPDEIETRVVDLRGDTDRVVVPLRGADVAGERDVRRGERDVPILVLDVQLDRVQAVGLHRDVLVELPGMLASAIVTWTPRTSAGSGRGCRPFGFGCAGADARSGAWSRLRCVASSAPTTPAAINASRRPATVSRCFRLRRRASRRRSLHCSFGSTGWSSDGTNGGS